MLKRAEKPILQFTDRHGNPCSGGILHTYVGPDSSTPVATFADQNGTLNPVKISLDSAGCTQTEVWLDPAMCYKFIVTDKHGAEVFTAKNVTANVQTFTADGADGIQVTEEQTDDGRTVLHFSIADNSIAWSKLKSPRHLIADTDWIEFEAQPNSDFVVVSLAKRVRDWLEEHMDG